MVPCSFYSTSMPGHVKTWNIPLILILLYAQSVTHPVAFFPFDPRNSSKIYKLQQTHIKHTREYHLLSLHSPTESDESSWSTVLLIRYVWNACMHHWGTEYWCKRFPCWILQYECMYASQIYCKQPLARTLPMTLTRGCFSICCHQVVALFHKNKHPDTASVYS